MRFYLMEMWDTFFMFGDPTMLASAIYGCLWLGLASMLLVWRFRTTRFQKWLSLSLFFLAALFTIVRAAVLASINVSMAPNASVGLIEGPPLWLSAAGISCGVVVGWLIGSHTNKPLKGWNNRILAVSFSLLFPGLGQVYYGHYLWGLFAFYVLSLLTSMFHIWGFIALFLLIQATTLLNDKLTALMVPRKDHP